MGVKTQTARDVFLRIRNLILSENDHVPPIYMSRKHSSCAGWGISVVGVSPVFNDTQCGYPAEFDTGDTFFSPRVRSFSIFFPTTSYHIRALFSAPNLGVVWGSGPKISAESGSFFLMAVCQN